jgi:hypothetical protein
VSRFAARLGVVASQIPDACQVKSGGEIREFDTTEDLQTHLGKTAYARQTAAKQSKKRAGG